MILTPVAEIARRLADRAEQVCEMLLPQGRRCKNQWLAGDAYGKAGESLKVNLAAPHAGQWTDWARQEDRGDLLDLWRIARGLDAGTAIKEAKAFLGIRDLELRRERKTYNKPSSNGEKPLDETASRWRRGRRVSRCRFSRAHTKGKVTIRDRTCSAYGAVRRKRAKAPF